MRPSRDLSILSCAAATVLLLGLTSPASAGGPLALCAADVPLKWPNGGANIPYNTDLGDLGPLSGSEAVALVSNAFQQWQDLPTASTTFVNAGSLPLDVNVDNFFPYYFPSEPDGLSAIVFDDTGEIFDLLFGPGSGVLGFASPEWLDPINCTVTEGSSFLNGPSFDDASVALDVLVHEFGHYQGLAHTVVNGQILIGDHRGPSPFDTFPDEPLEGKIETMYPFYFGPVSGTSTPQKDDIAMLSSLYPEPGFLTDSASISGHILAFKGSSPLWGVNVIARNIANPYEDAVSAISGDHMVLFPMIPDPNFPFPDFDDPRFGKYTLRGLTPGASYAIYVDKILAGGFSTQPLNPLPGPEELYNGANESSDPDIDNPLESTTVSAAAGATASGIDIIFQTYKPGPLPMVDEGNIELPIPFPFMFCGREFNSVFVNDNGSLTFGSPAGNGDFDEAADWMLNRKTRIAGLWQDYDPGAGGVISFAQTDKTFTVSWDDVPEFGIDNSHTFSITLKAAEDDDHPGHHDNDLGNAFTVKYGNLDTQTGIAGFACGPRITSFHELETDLRTSPTQSKRTISGAGKTAVYEAFWTNDNDLDNFEIRYTGTSKFTDQYEPNNSLAQAKKIQLPFNTSPNSKFTEIGNNGADVDFYKFNAQAGQILVAETVPGTSWSDTVLGLFDKNGNLLTLDDDDGWLFMSRLIYQIPQNGEYALAVSSYPDYEFVGNGLAPSRYVLNVKAYKGTILPFDGEEDDDASFQVPLSFQFPFQGQNWSSVFVNANGNLTFGAGDSDFSPSVSELLAGPPRIAPLWRDLFPQGGLVIAEPTQNSLAIHYVSVPGLSYDDFLTKPSNGGTPEGFLPELHPNYFSVELNKNGKIEMEWQVVDRLPSVLTGLSEGGGADDPGSEDLSSAKKLSALGTVYQMFAAQGFYFSDFDLHLKKLTFKPNDPH